MVYQDLEFPQIDDRPLFYTNFVSTVDGKVQVIPPEGYWPIGSKEDFDSLIGLRTHADLLIHGKNTALQALPTLKRLADPEFRSAREARGQKAQLDYLILAPDPAEIASALGTDQGYKVLDQRDLGQLAKDLFQQGYKRVLVEGGPTLIGQFLKAELLDQIFLTIAPKIFGNEKGKTLTMVEGVLFAPEQVPTLTLLESHVVDMEIFARYGVNYEGK